jgi:hypothetical protein
MDTYEQILKKVKIKEPTASDIGAVIDCMIHYDGDAETSLIDLNVEYDANDITKLQNWLDSKLNKN